MRLPLSNTLKDLRGERVNNLNYVVMVVAVDIQQYIYNYCCKLAKIHQNKKLQYVA